MLITQLQNLKKIKIPSEQKYSIPIRFVPCFFFFFFFFWINFLVLIPTIRAHTPCNILIEVFGVLGRSRFRLFDIWIPYFGIMSQYDPMFDLKIFVGHCDLYFMVQWFCLISWKLFSGWTSYFGIMSQYDMTFDLKITVGHYDLYFMVQWFCLIS